MPRVALLPLLFAALPAAAAEPAKRPNVVFIVADDLGWADVGFHAKPLKTPNLDTLAAGGVELHRHYVNPMCSTTRTSLMTGRYAARFGVTGAQNERALPWGTVTLASALKAAGYETAIAGKWHLGSTPEWGPQKFGFGHAYGSLAGGCGPYDHRYKTGPYTHTWHRNAKPVEEEGHVTDLIAKEAVGWLEGRKGSGKPFFLYVPFTAPHIPIDEPEKWTAMYPGVMEPAARQYAACVTHMDDAVGRIVAAVEKIGAKKTTLVVFHSDNGGSPGAKNNDAQYPDGGTKYAAGPAGGSNLPLRGNKTQLYEGGVRVPALAYWPGTLKPGTCEQVIHAVDWLPTLSGLSGYKMPDVDLNWDGRDVWPAVTGAAKPGPRRVYWAGVGFKSRALRDGDMKLIVGAAKANAESVELFDLAADPNEEKNLAEARPADVERLKKLLAAESARDNEAKVKDPASKEK